MNPSSVIDRQTDKPTIKAHERESGQKVGPGVKTFMLARIGPTGWVFGCLIITVMTHGDNAVLFASLCIFMFVEIILTAVNPEIRTHQ